MAARKKTVEELGAWVAFEDEAGQSPAPPRARTWGRRGRTPVVTVSGRRPGRVSAAALCCYRPGHACRLFYRTHAYHRRAGERASFTEADYIRLVDAAHRVLGAPIVLVWDNLNRHTSAAMRRLVGRRSWLRVVRLPAYAPELNPAEGVWAQVKGGLGNLTAGGVDRLAVLIGRRLRSLQYRPDLLDGFLAETGLTFDT